MTGLSATMIFRRRAGSTNFRPLTWRPRSINGKHALPARGQTLCLHRKPLKMPLLGEMWKKSDASNDNHNNDSNDVVPEDFRCSNSSPTTPDSNDRNDNSTIPLGQLCDLPFCGNTGSVVCTAGCQKHFCASCIDQLEMNLVSLKLAGV